MRFLQLDVRLGHPSDERASPKSTASYPDLAPLCGSGCTKKEPRTSDGPGAPPPARWLGTCFVDEVERRLSCPSEAGEAGIRDDLADRSLAGLGTQRVPATLGQGARHAQEGREVVVHPPHRVHVVGHVVVRERLD